MKLWGLALFFFISRAFAQPIGIHSDNLDALEAFGLNYTRIWPGAVLEMVDEYVKGNTMGPPPRKTIVPWARSNEPGYLYGGNKFDLDKWNPDLFARLMDFIVKAAQREIVVEICFFNARIGGLSLPYITRTTYRGSASAISRTRRR
jgi:hypothetical protein